MAKHGKRKASKAAEQFSALPSIATAESFAAWLGLSTDGASEPVTPYTVMGLSAVIRSVSVISTTIAGLPLRTYERGTDGSRARIASVFDDPYPDLDGLVPFAWTETVLIHLLLWRNAYLWHDARDARSGYVTAYRPINPDLITKTEKVGGKYRFTYLDDDKKEQTVGSETITYIPGPSLDGMFGNPLLYSARAIFAGALAGDKAASLTLNRGIRLAGLLVPEEGEQVEGAEGEEILKELRKKIVGQEHAGDIALINRRLKLQPWTPTNVESQWAETRREVLGEVGRLFGVPAHLLNDTEKQTSWGTGVAEQNLGFSRYTLRGWSDRIEQVLTRRLPEDQFVEFDYKGLLQGTPAEEIGLVIQQVAAGLMSLEYACQLLNLPNPTPEQKAVIAPPAPPTPMPVRQEQTA